MFGEKSFNEVQVVSRGIVTENGNLMTIRFELTSGTSNELTHQRASSMINLSIIIIVIIIASGVVGNVDFARCRQESSNLVIRLIIGVIIYVTI